VAQQQLERTDALYAQGDPAGSVDAYLAAVKADPAAADLETGFDRFHYLLYESPSEHLFHRIELPESGGAFFERDVNVIDDVPLGETTLSEIYLLFRRPRRR
jgi:hypothetical protein